ncbi:MAG: hypothetical protein WB347_21940 [Terriglobales bacterium]|jgi:hypothetical protein
MINPVGFFVGITIAALLSVGASKCSSSSTPDAGTTICQAACANLATLGCAEGIDPTCVTTCTSAQTRGLTDLKPACLAAAIGVGDVQACGTVACTTDPAVNVPATCANACAVLKRLGCSEAATCPAECPKVQGKATDLKLACLVAAKTRAQLQACGTVACR